MNINPLHAWDLSPSEAITLQKSLAPQLIDRALPLSQIQTVAGVDVSVQNGISQAAVVVLSFPHLQIIETVRAQMPTPFPYISGLLTFREGQALLAAFAQLQHVPDVFLFDGMGRIHPRRIGIAAHMGLWLNVPTLGCGKTHFLGQYDTPAPTRGSSSPLTDRDEVIGAVLRTRDNVKPVYISAGHLLDLASALTITLACTTRYRLPDPIRAAHLAAGQMTG